MTNNFFILAETLIIFTYVTSLSTNRYLVFRPLLVAGISISILWLLMNLQFFIQGLNLEIDYYTQLTEDKKLIFSRTYNLPTYWNLLLKLSFWTFMGIPIFFLVFQAILFFN